jgi:hypothetical protein
MLKIKEKYPIVKKEFIDPLIKNVYKEFKRFQSNRRVQDIERRHHLFMVGYHADLAAARDEGFAIGFARGLTEVVLDILNNRFGQVPQSIVDSLSQQTDHAVLESLLVRASECMSLDEFVAGL